MTKMSDDMVWQNAGDTSLPRIGLWEGKDEIFGFLGVFTENFQTTKWENTDAFAFGDTVAVFSPISMGHFYQCFWNGRAHV